MKRKHFFLTAPQLAALEAQTKHSGLSEGEIIRRALDEYLSRNPVPAAPAKPETQRTKA